jgi:hypothetical protein
MATNVVQLDRNAAARRVSAEAHRRYVAERSARELDAIRRNRFARLRSTRRWWFAMLGMGTLASFTAGVGLMYWLSQSPKNLSLQAIPSTSSSSVNQVATNMPLATPSAAVQPVLQTVTSSIPMPTNTAMVSTSVSMTVSSLPISMPVGSQPNNSATGTVAQARPAGRLIPILNKDARVEAAVKPPSIIQLKQAATIPNTQFESVVTSSVPAIPAAIVKPSLPVPGSALVNATNVAPIPTYSSVGVPVDGVLQIQIGNDPSIKHYRVGQRLPGGEVLRRAISETGQVETSERSFTVR